MTRVRETAEQTLTRILSPPGANDGIGREEIRMLKRALIGAAAIAALSGPGYAQQTGWYVGAGIGPSGAPIDDDFVQVAGATAGTISRDDSDTGWKLFAGYRADRHFALEGAYVKLGEFGARHNVTAPAAGSLRRDFKASGWTFDAVGILPFSDRWSGFLKAGAFFSRVESSATTTGFGLPPGVPAKSKRSEVNFKFGVGGQLDFTPRFGVRAELDHFFDVGDEKTGEGDIVLVSISLVVRF